MSFEIKTENFEGPIDLLLNLIEKRKLTISDISLAEITDDYIKFFNSIKDQSFIKMTYFIYVASTLVLIKSKSLLPNLKFTEDENDDIENLKRHIEIFKIYIDISKSLKNLFLSEKKFFSPKIRKKDVSFTPNSDFTSDTLKKSLLNVLNNVPKFSNKKKEAYIRISINIEEMMDSLCERIKQSAEVNFNNFIQPKLNNLNNKKEIKVYNVIGFLALLELVKKGTLNVLQEESFNNILINSIK